MDWKWLLEELKTEQAHYLTRMGYFITNIRLMSQDIGVKYHMKIYPQYNPGNGIREFVKMNFKEYRKEYRNG